MFHLQTFLYVKSSVYLLLFELNIIYFNENFRKLCYIMIGKRIVNITSPLYVSAKSISKRHFASKMFKEKYAKIRPFKTPTMIAMDNFDFYYGPVYGNSWPSIRLGLLTPNKYFAVLNKFSRLINFSIFQNN